MTSLVPEVTGSSLLFMGRCLDSCSLMDDSGMRSLPAFAAFGQHLHAERKAWASQRLVYSSIPA